MSTRVSLLEQSAVGTPRGEASSSISFSADQYQLNALRQELETAKRDTEHERAKARAAEHESVQSRGKLTVQESMKPVPRSASTPISVPAVLTMGFERARSMNADGTPRSPQPRRHHGSSPVIRPRKNSVGAGAKSPVSPRASLNSTTPLPQKYSESEDAPFPGGKGEPSDTSMSPSFGGKGHDDDDDDNNDAEPDTLFFPKAFVGEEDSEGNNGGPASHNVEIRASSFESEKSLSSEGTPSPRKEAAKEKGAVVVGVPAESKKDRKPVESKKESEVKPKPANVEQKLERLALGNGHIFESESQEKVAIRAATKIQSAFRGLQCRRKIMHKQNELQKSFEGSTNRKMSALLAGLNSSQAEEARAAIKIQANYRGFVVRKELQKEQEAAIKMQSVLKDHKVRGMVSDGMEAEVKERYARLSLTEYEMRHMPEQQQQEEQQPQQNIVKSASTSSVFSADSTMSDFGSARQSHELNDSDIALIERMGEKQFGNGNGNENGNGKRTVTSSRSNSGSSANRAHSLSPTAETNMVLAQLSLDERQLIEDAPSDPFEDSKVAVNPNSQFHRGGSASAIDRPMRRMSSNFEVDAALLGINSNTTTSLLADKDDATTDQKKVKAKVHAQKECEKEKEKEKDQKVVVKTVKPEKGKGKGKGKEGTPANGGSTKGMSKRSVSLSSQPSVQELKEEEMKTSALLPDEKPVVDVDLESSFAGRRATAIWEAKTTGSGKKAGQSSWKTRLQAKVNNSPSRDDKVGRFSLKDALLSKSPDGSIGGLAKVVGAGLRHRPRRSISDVYAPDDESALQVAQTVGLAVNKMGGSLLQRVREMKAAEEVATAAAEAAEAAEALKGSANQVQGRSALGSPSSRKVDTITEEPDRSIPNAESSSMPKSALKKSKKKGSLWGGIQVKEISGSNSVASKVSMHEPDFEEEVINEDMSYFPGSQDGVGEDREGEGRSNSGGSNGGGDDDDDGSGWDERAPRNVSVRYADTHDSEDNGGWDDEDDEGMDLASSKGRSEVSTVGTGKRSCGSCVWSCCRMVSFVMFLVLLAVTGLFLWFKLNATSS